MKQRDWQKDWAWANDPNVCLSERVREMLVHYLQRVRELESQAAVMQERLEKLEGVAEAARPAADALRYWLVDIDTWCECEGECRCGRTERLRELKELEQALAALDGKEI